MKLSEIEIKVQLRKHQKIQKQIVMGEVKPKIKKNF